MPLLKSDEEFGEFVAKQDVSQLEESFIDVEVPALRVGQPCSRCQQAVVVNKVVDRWMWVERQRVLVHDLRARLCPACQATDLSGAEYRRARSLARLLLQSRLAA